MSTTTRTKGTRSKRAVFEREALIHLHDLHLTALRFTRHDREAEDLVQDTLLKAYRSFHQFEPGTNCRAWLMRILRNTFINRYRRRRKERDILGRQETGVLPQTLVSTAVQKHGHPEARLVRNGLSDPVEEALNGLPAAFREVVVLADLENRSYKEIAAKMGTPMGTVMSRLFRGRKLLAAQLAAFAFEEGILREDPAAATA